MRSEQIKNWFQWPLTVWMAVALVQLVLQIFFLTRYPGQLEAFFFHDIGFFFVATLPFFLLVSVFNFGTQQISIYWVKATCNVIMLSLFTFYYYWNYLTFNISRYFITLDALRFSWLNTYLQLKFFLHAQPYELLKFFGGWALVFGLSLIAFKILYRLNFQYSVPRWFLCAFYVLACSFAILLMAGSIPRYLLRIEPLSGAIQDYFRQSIVLPDVPEGQNWTILNRPILSVEDYLKDVAAVNDKKKNVIVILVESLRPDQLTSFSGRESSMENVDKLAQKSVLFTRAYSQSAHSNYANPAVFSSQYPLRSNRIHFYPNDHKYPRLFIYDLLKGWGYKTAMFSSQDEAWGNMSGYMKTKGLDEFYHAGNFSGEAYIPMQETGFTRWLQGDKLSGNIDDSITVGATLKWMDSVGAEPFFIYMNLQNSHFPYVIPRDFPRRKSAGGINFSQNIMQPDLKSVELERARYSDSLSYVDSQIARVIQYLEEHHLMQNTVLVVTGDNGESFFEHQGLGHLGLLYEEAVHVPFILYVPGIKHKIDDRPAMHIDIAPTLLSILGLPEHPGFQGLNLLSADHNSKRVRFLVSQSPFVHQFAVVQDSYKLLWRPLGRSLELYNIMQDPSEQKDLAKLEPDKARQLAGYLKLWFQTQINYYANPQEYLHMYPPYYLEKSNE